MSNYKNFYRYNLVDFGELLSPNKTNRFSRKSIYAGEPITLTADISNFLFLQV